MNAHFITQYFHNQLVLAFFSRKSFCFEKNKNIELLKFFKRSIKHFEYILEHYNNYMVENLAIDEALLERFVDYFLTNEKVPYLIENKLLAEYLLVSAMNGLHLRHFKAKKSRFL